jgi:hypothetical protein
MCGPSKEMQGLNNRLQTLASSLESNAQTVFGTTNSVVNDLLNSVRSIVRGGVNAFGFSSAEVNAQVSRAVSSSAAAYRNIKAAVGGALSAIGGGNVVTPSGLNATVETGSAAAAESAKMQAIQNTFLSGYALGHEQFFKAAGIEANVPGIFSTATEAGKTAIAANKEAQTSQQNMDTQKNWWKADVMKAAAVGAAAIPGVGPAISDVIQGMTPGSSGLPNSTAADATSARKSITGLFKGSGDNGSGDNTIPDSEYVS